MKIDPDKITNFDWKLNGFYNMPRRIVAKLFKKEITFDQFGLLMIYVANADWDDRHKNYAICKISNNEIAKNVIGLNKNKIAIAKNTLEIKRYIKILRREGNQHRVKILRPKQFFQDMTSRINPKLSRSKDRKQR